jgi:hypothetical protein
MSCAISNEFIRIYALLHILCWKLQVICPQGPQWLARRPRTRPPPTCGHRLNQRLDQADKLAYWICLVIFVRAIRELQQEISERG